MHGWSMSNNIICQKKFCVKSEQLLMLIVFIQPHPHHHDKTVRGVYPAPAVSQRPILAHQADRQ